MKNASTDSALPSDKLILFFIDHLNRIYCAKAHLRERLPEVKDHAYFADLTDAIVKTLADVEKQILRMDKIYELLKAENNFEKCQGMIGLLEDTFDAIYSESNSAELRDLSILFYLQNIESIQVASYKMLVITANKINNKQIIKSLTDNLTEANDDLALFQTIAENYLKTV
jgi:ferritin-like metal-binding protein YciE